MANRAVVSLPICDNYNITFFKETPQPGELVALCCKQYNERPQIAKILTLSGSKATVRWYNGTWTRKWVVYTYMKGRSKVPWDEEVTIKDIICTKVNFTASGVLTAHCRRDLEQCYGSLSQ